MVYKLINEHQAYSFAAIFEKLKAHYKRKYAKINPGHTVVPTIMLHNSSIHILIDGKLQETISFSHLKNIDKNKDQWP